MSECHWIVSDLHEALENHPDGILCESLNTDPFMIKMVKQGFNLDAEWASQFTCSVCGWNDWDTYTATESTYNYCPGCGAKMVEKEVTDDE